LNLNVNKGIKTDFIYDAGVNMTTNNQIKKRHALLPKDYLHRCNHKHAKSKLSEGRIKSLVCRNCGKEIRVRK
jgi:transcription elongation factor Elf1